MKRIYLVSISDSRFSTPVIVKACPSAAKAQALVAQTAIKKMAEFTKECAPLYDGDQRGGHIIAVESSENRVMLRLHTIDYDYTLEVWAYDIPYECDEGV